MFGGSIVALVTPMNEKGEIDYKSLGTLIDFHLQNHTDGLVIMGTTGESATVTLEEQQKTLNCVLKQVNGKIPVIAGTGVTSTQKSIELTVKAMQMGVDACLLMAPAYVKPTQEGLFRHFEAIAKQAALPLIVYNVPGRTACDILPETVERLAQIPNIVGIKEASGELARAQTIIGRCKDHLDVLSGDDFIAKDTILIGGKGVISVTANVAPKLMHEMCEFALKGENEKAEAIDKQLAELHKVLFVEANPIPVKWALHRMGLIGSGIRLPLTWLSSKHHMDLENVLRQIGLL